MAREINKFERSGNGMAIYSHINAELFQMIDAENIRTIFFAYDKDWANATYPNENDVKLLNSFFKTHKYITMDIEKNWMIQLLPEVECFRFSKYNGEAIELLKKNIVRKLHFNHSADIRTDLTDLLPFGDTLEHLYLDASQYKPHYKFEAMLNGMKKLKYLYVSSIKIDFSLVDENSTIEDFYFYGSKTKDWSGIEKFTRLKNLRVKNNTTMSGLGFLQNLPCLETAEFWWCSRIVQFPDLSHLVNLKKIHAFECNRLEDVEELKKLSGVEIHVQGKVLADKSFKTE